MRQSRPQLFFGNAAHNCGIVSVRIRFASALAYITHSRFLSSLRCAESLQTLDFFYQPAKARNAGQLRSGKAHLHTGLPRAKVLNKGLFSA